MSADVLRAILCKMKPVKRLELASMDDELYQLAACFNDVDSLLVDETKIFFGGRQNICKSGPISSKLKSHHLSRLFLHCPAILRLVIQTRLAAEEIHELEQVTDSLHKLFISNENFRADSQWQNLQFKKLKSLGILQKVNHKMSLKTQIAAEHLKPFLSPNLSHVSLVGVVLLPNTLPALFSLPNIRSLELLGALIDSKEGAAVIPSLTSPPKLEEVSFPPSLFSFSKNNIVNFNFHWLMAPKISVYMQYFHGDSFKKDLQLFNKDLKILTLYGNYNRAKLSPMMKKLKKIEIHYGSNKPKYMRKSFARQVAPLISHYVRSSPYTGSDRHANRNASWQFTLTGAEDDQPIRQVPREGWDLPAIIRWLVLQGHGIAHHPLPRAAPRRPQALLALPAAENPRPVRGRPPQQERID